MKQFDSPPQNDDRKFKYTELDGTERIGTFVEMDNGTLIYLDENGKEQAMMYEQ